MKYGIFFLGSVNRAVTQFCLHYPGKLTAKQEFICEILLGGVLTKTFLHIPLMGANPIGFK